MRSKCKNILKLLHISKYQSYNAFFCHLKLSISIWDYERLGFRHSDCDLNPSISMAHFINLFLLCTKNLPSNFPSVNGAEVADYRRNKNKTKIKTNNYDNRNNLV